LNITLAEVAEEDTITGVGIDSKEGASKGWPSSKKVGNKDLPCGPYRNASKVSCSQGSLRRLSKIAQDCTLACLWVDHKQCTTWELKQWWRWTTSLRSSICVNNQDIACFDLRLGSIDG
jgi:hypothetical protein